MESPQSLSTDTKTPENLPNEWTVCVVEVKALNSKIAYKPYVKVNIPESCSQVKMILFEVESRNQGRTNHENRSYSWGDLVVKSRSGQELYRLNRAYENGVASVDYQMHVKHYCEGDEIVQKCKPGTTLELILNAQYRNWANLAKYGRIAVYIQR